MSSIFIGKEYEVSPSTINIDPEYVGFNRTHTELEYQATKKSIQTIGQQQPIAINNNSGLCEDGRHRLKACKELGKLVRCRMVDNSIDKATRLEIYNIDAMSGRDLTTAQRAIQAHKFMITTKCTLLDAATKYKTNERVMNSANTIAGLGVGDSVFAELMITGVWVKPDGRRTKDLRAIASILKAKEEDIQEDTTEEVKIRYGDLVKTELGKSKYYQLVEGVMDSNDTMKRMVVEYLNMKYKVVEPLPVTDYIAKYNKSISKQVSIAP